MGKFTIFSGACVIALLIGAVSQTSAQDAESAEITWHEDAQDAIRIARKEKRPLLIYVESADCFYCRKMEKRTWSDAVVAAAVQKSFVPLKLNAELHAKEVAQLNVAAFPTTILLTAQIKIHDAAVGMLSADELSRMLARGPASVAQQPVDRQ